MARRVPFQGLEDTGRVTGSTMADELDEVLLVWKASQVHTPLTLVKMTETVHRFAGRLSAQGVRSFTQVAPGQAAAFVLAPLADGRPRRFPPATFGAPRYAPCTGRCVSCATTWGTRRWT
ncbi:hypothetical protein [Cellulomonas sp. P24]|uniref:hypothetical protein n=1 Tax=Cellulomonas sp. P24 TaxID=2885206 RepID=UPI00216AE52B|nr:hypothetical protein [Cellulomonas sp. P24]MCR6491440.1 hypothetical protein [Cellulomonas sp. P24]